MAGHTITSGLEGAWTPTPTKWDNTFFDTLFGHEWELTKSPAGAFQWKPKNGASADRVPDAHDPKKRHAPTMLTTDLALRVDPVYEKISRRFHKNPQELAEAFAKSHPDGVRTWDRTVLAGTSYTVEVLLMDHGTPSAAYIVRETPRTNIDHCDPSSDGCTRPDCG